MGHTVPSYRGLSPDLTSLPPLSFGSCSDFTISKRVVTSPRYPIYNSYFFAPSAVLTPLPSLHFLCITYHHLTYGIFYVFMVCLHSSRKLWESRESFLSPSLSRPLCQEALTCRKHQVQARKDRTHGGQPGKAGGRWWETRECGTSSVCRGRCYGWSVSSPPRKIFTWLSPNPPHSSI